MDNDRGLTSLRLLKAALIAAVVAVPILLLLPAVQQAREAARRSESKNNLKQLGLALHNYHDLHGVFPPGGIYSADGRPYHCWTTMIRPYLDANPFFNYVDFSRPWDDPDGNYDHFLNRGMIHSLLNPSIEESQSPEGLQLAHYAGSDRIFYRNSSVGIPDLTTGAANVLLAGESFGGYPPLGLPVNWRDPRLGLRRHEHGFGYGYLRGRDTFVLLADGACRALNEEVDGPEFARLIGPDELTPSDEQRAKLTAPFKPPKRYWRRVFVEFEGRTQPWDKPTVWESRNPDGDVVAVEFDYSFKGDKVDPTIAEVKQVLRPSTIREVTSHGPLGDDAIPILATLPKLEKLEFVGGRVTDRGLAALQSVQSLRELHIGRTAVTAHGIEAFRAARPNCRLVVMQEPSSDEP